MERKIGETFNFRGKTYTAVKGNKNSCMDCAFEGNCPIVKDHPEELGDCENDERSDRTDVVFVEVKPGDLPINEVKRDNWPINQVRVSLPESEFDRITREMAKHHANKYGNDDDEFSDLFKEFGMNAAIVYLNSRIKRLKALANKEVKSETVREALIDLACRAVMTIEEFDKTTLKG